MSMYQYQHHILELSLKVSSRSLVVHLAINCAMVDLVKARAFQSSYSVNIISL